MPEDRTLPPQPVRVDWEASDIELSEAVKTAVKKLKEADGPPVRASITAICREVGHRSWIETRLDQLPLTAKAIAEHVESAEDFLIRRLQWTADQYRQQDLLLTRRQLKRLVSVNSAVGRTEKVQRTLNEIMSMSGSGHIASLIPESGKIKRGTIQIFRICENTKDANI